MSKLAKALTAAAGNAGGGTLGYVEDVFSTYLYDGTGTANNIVNGIDLSGEGGLVWLKARNTAQQHFQFDTERGTAPYLVSNSTAAQVIDAGYHISSYNANGFSLQGNGTGTNNTSYNYASWTFRKAEKFFDVVTYTGTGTPQTISHNLGVAPAFIITKKTSSTSNWATNDPSQANPWSGALLLNSTSAFTTASTVWNNTAPTDSVFTVGTADATNVSGQTYVAYLFASDAGGFGDDGSESIIKCGSYTGNGSVDGTEVDCGFEPQFLLLKAASTTGNWLIYDNMRGFVTGSDDAYLRPNLSSEEGLFESGEFLANGFKLKTTDSVLNGSGSTYIYIAIRRPMKTPESGTEVFAPTAYSGTEPTPQYFSTGFTVDFNLYTYRTLSIGTSAWDRLRGGDKYLTTSSTAAEGDISGNSSAQILAQQFERNDGFSVGTGGANASSVIAYSFKRATGFFDVVCYTGNYSINQINHNLNVVPELVILKARTASSAFDAWLTGALFESSSFTQLFLNTVDQAQSRSYGFFEYLYAKPTSDTITIGRSDIVNASGGKYIAYLFASVAGVSKVGSYTGTGSFIDIDCGFSTGARFILIKRTDSTGDWYVWDSARGIVAGNDPYLLLNSTTAEVTSTDYIDPLSSGFRITTAGAEGPLGASGGTYIFLAIA